MNIAFITTQSIHGSTVTGRILPLAEELSHKHVITVLAHESHNSEPVHHFNPSVNIQFYGKDPFIRVPSGKQRLHGVALALRTVINVVRAVLHLKKLQPDIVIISKTLPESVLAGQLYSFLAFRKIRFVTDIDDFELTANMLSSLTQRAAIHWAERAAIKLSHTCIAATPFLADHFEQLSHKSIPIVPTGISTRLYNRLGKHRSSMDSKDVLLYAGSMTASSGHRIDMLPAMCEHLVRNRPGIKLIMAGSGDDIDRIREVLHTQDNGYRVEWLGRFSLDDIAAITLKSSIIIDPIDASITCRAKSSFRTILACSAGIPVVTSNIGIRTQLIPSEFHDRFFAIPGDSLSYAEKVYDLFVNPLSDVERSHLRNHTKSFRWDVLSNEYDRYILDHW